MRKLFITLLMLASTLIFAQTGEKNYIDRNYIEVIGKAEMEIIPDHIYIGIHISEKNLKNKLSIADIEKSMIEKLKNIGIDTEKNLTVKDIASIYQSYWLKKTDIFMTKEYQLLVNDAGTAGKVFDELKKIGISNISIDKLSHSKIREYRKQIKINAIKAAREKAKDLAMAIGQDIGRALYIKEGEYNRSVSNVLAGQASGFYVRGESSLTSSYKFRDVEFEKIIIEYSILCRFELK